MARDKSKKLESDILREICEKLQEEKLFFWRSNNIPIFARSNDGKYRFRALPKFTPKGLPDIMVVHKGQFIGLEVKREKAGLRPEQSKFRENLVNNGGFYYVVTSIESLSMVLTLHK